MEIAAFPLPIEQWGEILCICFTPFIGNTCESQIVPCWNFNDAVFTLRRKKKKRKKTETQTHFVCGEGCFISNLKKKKAQETSVSDYEHNIYNGRI